MKLYKCTKNIFGFEKRIRKFCCLPSDEGSGLKFRLRTFNSIIRTVFPRMREEDWSCMQSLYLQAWHLVFPRMREVDWSTITVKLSYRISRLPSDEGSGLKWPSVFWRVCAVWSSLGWGKWIEVAPAGFPKVFTICLPSDEGSGLKYILSRL